MRKGIPGIEPRDGFKFLPRLRMTPCERQLFPQERVRFPRFRIEPQ